MSSPIGGLRRGLPTDLAPGTEAIVWATLHSPRELGRNEVVPCLAQRGRDAVRCFDSPESRNALRVGRRPARRD